MSQAARWDNKEGAYALKCCNHREAVGDPIKNRGLIELAQGGGTHWHLPEQTSSTSLIRNPSHRLNL